MELRTMPGQNKIGGGALAVALLSALLQGLTGCGGASESATADPAVIDYPLVYVKRPLPRDDDGNRIDLDVREPAAHGPGGDLYVRDRAKVSAAERNITASLTGTNGDVKDPAVSWDGRRIAFALREEDPNPDDDEEPAWDIYEYDLDSGRLSRIIPDDTTAAEGDDIAPTYLPDGRIVFASTRQRTTGAIQLVENKPQYPGLDEDRNEPAFVLHVMDPDGSNIDQITFNQSHDLDPAVLADGRIVFVRWDNMGGRDGMHLYTVRPDGTGLQLLYGARSHETGSGDTDVQFLSPRPVGNGRVLALLRPFAGTDFGGDLVEVEAGSFVEVDQPTWPNQGLTYAGQAPATDKSVSTEPGASYYGRFSSYYPLYDGTDRMLVSWSACFVQSGNNAVPCTRDNLDQPAAAPLYGLWILSPEGTQLPVVPPEAGWMITDAVVARDRPYPASLSELTPPVGMDDVGVIDIRSVYDVDGVDTANPDIDTLADPAATDAADRPAHFLRIVKAVPIPDDEVYDFDNAAYGRSTNQLMREIIGYAPVEPDGSVKVQVPANVPLALSVVDSRGRRISDRHRAWLQVRPGETLSCNGCHDSGSDVSHGRDEAFQPVHDGLAQTDVNYPNTDPNLFGSPGETMAQIAYTQVQGDADAVNDERIQPSVDVYFEDIWTDPNDTPDMAYRYSYRDLGTYATIGPDAVPVAERCLPNPGNAWSNWAADCRIVINFTDHIQPLWDLERTVDATNLPVVQSLATGIDQLDEMTVAEGDPFSCTTCHRPTDAAGAAQAVPAGQLNLMPNASDQEAAHLYGYRELFFQDNEQELSGGSLVDRLVDTGECQTNADGEPVDDMGNVVDDPADCATIMETVPVQPVMSVNGALASDGFFDLFEAGGSHEGLLTPAELRLVAEWVDIGGQYYNNPFDAPEQ
ncbi:PD40 domain-containing protein [Ectothiorhodospiraceae bacterium WFHF3C12]|nr:PD40 domain-containing protein [Ectothiorhodospiraceae bacterium WFHF3C12]